MRVLFAVAAIAVGLAGASHAQAADKHAVRSPKITHPQSKGLHYQPRGVHAPVLFVYDFEPGVELREYWAPPWRNRHYFPFTGKRPKVGRRENLAAVRPAQKPVPMFYREWSTLSLYPPRVVLPRADVAPPTPLFAPLM